MRCSKRPCGAPRGRNGDALAGEVGIQDMTRRLAFLTALTASAVACDVANPTLAVRVEVSPTAIVAGGGDTTNIRLTLTNLTAHRIDLEGPTCDNLFAVETLVGNVVVSNYRITCPTENWAPWGIELAPFGSVELTRRWTGVNVRYANGGYETVPLPPGNYRIRGTFGELRSQPQAIALTTP